MKELETLRKAIGLTQSEMAIYLGIPISTLGMVESNLRRLPISSMEKYISMQKAFDKVEKKKKPGISSSEQHSKMADLQKKTINEFRHHAEYCILKADNLKEKLADLENKEKSLSRLLDVMDELLLNQAGKDRSLNEWLKLQRSLAATKILKTNKIAQLKLSAKIELLKAEAAINKKLLTSI